MPICPICKNEYREGIKMCHDCKVELVDDLLCIAKPILSSDEQTLEILCAETKNEGLLTGSIHFDKEKNEFQLFFETAEIDAAKKIIEDFIKAQELRQLAEYSGVDIDEINDQNAAEIKSQMLNEYKEYKSMEKASTKVQHVYVDKKTKVEEYKSSGIVLTGVGLFGYLIMILMYFNVITGFAGLKSNYLLISVMLFLFTVFIIVGIISLKKVSTLQKSASEEDLLVKQIKDWMNDQLTIESIATNLNDVSTAEEELYFARTAYMLKCMQETFLYMDTALMDQLVEERYCELYENNDH